MFFVSHYYGNTIKESLNERGLAIKEEREDFIVRKEKSLQELLQECKNITGCKNTFTASFSRAVHGRAGPTSGCAIARAGSHHPEAGPTALDHPSKASKDAHSIMRCSCEKAVAAGLSTDELDRNPGALSPALAATIQKLGAVQAAMQGGDAAPIIPVEDVSLGVILAAGRDSQVFRGEWNGAPVAVKVRVFFGLLKTWQDMRHQGIRCRRLFPHVTLLSSASIKSTTPPPPPPRGAQLLTAVASEPCLIGVLS